VFNMVREEPNVLAQAGDLYCFSKTTGEPVFAIRGGTDEQKMTAFQTMFDTKNLHAAWVNRDTAAALDDEISAVFNNVPE